MVTAFMPPIIGIEQRQPHPIAIPRATPLVIRDPFWHPPAPQKATQKQTGPGAMQVYNVRGYAVIGDGAMIDGSSILYHVGDTYLQQRILAISPSGMILADGSMVVPSQTQQDTSGGIAPPINAPNGPINTLPAATPPSP